MFELIFATLVLQNKDKMRLGIINLRSLSEA